MIQQVPLDPGSVAATDADDGVLEVAPDVAYLRLVFVNVIYVGQPANRTGCWWTPGFPGRRAASLRLR